MSLTRCDTAIFSKCIFINRVQCVNNDLQDDWKANFVASGLVLLDMAF